MTFKAGLKTLLLTCALAPLAGAAGATDLRYATGFPPGTTGAKNAEATAKMLGEMTGGDLTMQSFAQSLLSFGEMSAGVRDGVADAGFVLFPYTPAEFRNSAMAADLTMLFATMNTGDRGGLAWTGALSEYIIFNCPACQAEMEKQNQVYVSTSATEYSLMCDTPIESQDDLQGLKVRAPGANWARWASAFGAVPVQLSTAETYEGMSQGIIDCTISGMTEITDLGLTELVERVAPNFPGGGFGGSAMHNINRDTWAALTEEQRRAYVETVSKGGADLSWEYRENNASAAKAAAEAGIKIEPMSGPLMDDTNAWIQKDIENIATLYSKDYGLENTSESIETFHVIFEKWTGLVADVQSSEELGDLIWQEIGSKIDYSTYGL